MWRRDPRVWNLAVLYTLLSAGVVLAAFVAYATRESMAAGPAGAQKNEDGTYGPNRINPVKLNGAIFENWPQPRAVIVITGAQDGYIEPCGCAGLENQKGGMSRRADLLLQLAEKKWPVIALDTGGLVKGFGRQAIEKYTAAVDSLTEMKYNVIGLGAPELKLPVDELLGITNHPSFASANVVLDPLLPMPTYSVLNANGVTIGVTSILSGEEIKNINNKGLKLLDPMAALKSVIPELVKANCQRIIVLTYGSTQKEIDALVKQYPAITDIVTSGNGDIPPAQPALVPGTKTLVLETGHKGMYALALGIYDDPKEPLRYQRIPLDARFGDNEAIAKIFAKYQDTLANLGLQQLGVRAAPHPTGRGLFAGSEACGKCHTQAYKVWIDTPHAKAMKTLEEGTPPRQFDPECISCHATGWEPQKYYPYTGGYQNMKDTPHLAGNGCENCHGPGKKHVETELAAVTAPNKTDPKLLAALRSSMRVTRDATGCVQCHDVDNSPEFDFDSYWPSVEHKGKN